MTLASIDWTTITRKQARALAAAAASHERAAGRRYEAGLIGDAEFLAASNLEIDLHVYAVCGAKPGSYKYLKKHRDQAEGPWLP